MANLAQRRDNTKKRRILEMIAVLLAMSLLAMISCSKSSDTRSQAKEASQVGTYQIFVKITSPTNGAVYSFDAGGDSNVTYESIVSGGTEPYSYTWVVTGPTKTNVSSGSAPTISFWELGNYTVRLTITDAKGITASDTISVTLERGVLNEDLLVNITSPASDKTINVGDAVTFSGTVSFGTGTYDYYWEIPGGSPASSITTAATAASDQTTSDFNTAGTYTVKLTVTDSNGNAGSDTVKITVSGTQPTFNAQIIDPAIDFEFVVADTPAYAVEATDSDGVKASAGTSTLLRYFWEASDSSVTFSAENGQSGTLAFTKKGTFTITVTVKDIDTGDTTTDSMTITVK